MDRDHNYNMDITIRCVFGYNINTLKTLRENKVLIIQLEEADQKIFLSNIQNAAYHDKCGQHIQLLSGTKSLLGIGLKFVIERSLPYQDICASLQDFQKAVNLQCYLEENNLNKYKKFQPKIIRQINVDKSTMHQQQDC